MMMKIERSCLEMLESILDGIFVNENFTSQIDDTQEILDSFNIKEEEEVNIFLQALNFASYLFD